MKQDRKAWVRLVVFAVLFVGLTLAGVWYAVSRSGFGVAQLEDFQELPWWTKAGVAGFALAILGTDMWRLVMVGRAVGVRIGFGAALDATIANNFFSWITPGAALGEPATIYMLGRRGVPWDAAALIAFGKTATSVALVFGLAFLFLFLGLGPELHWAVMAPFVSGGTVVAGMVGVFVVGAIWPEPVKAWLRRKEVGWLARWPWRRPSLGRGLSKTVETTCQTVDRLVAFRAGGFKGGLTILIGHMLYYAAYAGLFMTIAAGLGATDLRGLLPVAVIYQTFTYSVPTPGGAGLSEGVAEVFFGGYLPPAKAVLTVLLFRGTTIYLHIVMGLVYLPIVGGMREIVERGKVQAVSSEGVEDGPADGTDAEG